jgi:malonate-semialdehyde dehydrogenase (acetylating)/methylmalonate-semialdehyde dehydrogenase
MGYDITHVIDGQEVAGSGETQPIMNPATGEQVGTLQLGDASTVDRAVQVALAAQKEWQQVSLAKRTQILYRMRELVIAATDEIAEVITREHGKTLGDAKGEIARGLETLEFATSITQDLKGGFSQNVSTGVDAHTLRQPLGVVAGITPFNFPAMVPFWMHPIALATGNAFILKPSERDPSASNIVARLYKEAGLPDGVFQVVHGGKAVVDALCTHDGIAGVSFVGSTPIARSIYTRAAANGKRVQALGGAKNHMVVMPDADLDAAADAAISAGYGAAGERCMAVSVVVAVGDIADDLVARIGQRIKDVKVCDGTTPGADMGPVITAASKQRIEGFVAGAAAEGATVVVDGRDHDMPTTGFFTGPTLVDNVKPGMAVYDEEIFGPVLSVVRVDTYDQAVELINNCRYANGTAVFTRDGRTARSFKFDIEVGMVGINVPIPVPIGSFSFGGWKDSLFGDTHMYGPESFNFYTRRKVVTERWPLPSESQITMGFPTN